MKNLFLVLALFTAGVSQSFAQSAEPSKATTISAIQLSYSQIVNGNMAIIGGQVAFTGPGPVFVNIAIGGQSYSQPADPSGNFSFLVYTNGAPQFQYGAWTTDAPLPENGQGLQLKRF